MMHHLSRRVAIKYPVPGYKVLMLLESGARNGCKLWILIYAVSLTNLGKSVRSIEDDNFNV